MGAEIPAAPVVPPRRALCFNEAAPRWARKRMLTFAGQLTFGGLQ